MWPTLMDVRTWQLVLVAAVIVSTMFLTMLVPEIWIEKSKNKKKNG